MAELVVSLRDVYKTYLGARPLEVLHGLSLQVATGEFIAIVGQSGSGKSTMLNIIGALDRPTAGTVAIDGLELAQLSEDELAEVRNSRIGFIFQFHYLLDEFTCLENALLPVMIGKGGRPTAKDVQRVQGLLERV